MGIFQLLIVKLRTDTVIINNELVAKINLENLLQTCRHIYFTQLRVDLAMFVWPSVWAPDYQLLEKLTLLFWNEDSCIS